MRSWHIALAGWCLLGCKAPNDHPSGLTETTIRLGTYGPLTGPQAAWGDSLRGMKAYFEWLNAQGGIHGRKIELYVKDDGYNPARTVRAARTLVERDKVFAVVGGIGTATGRAAAPVFEQAKIPFFTPASGAKWFTDKEGPTNVYSVYLPYRQEGRAIAQLVAKRLHLRSVAVLYQDDDFGREGTLGVEEGARALGLQVVAKAPVVPSDTDVSLAVSQLLKANPQAIVLYTAPRQAILLGRYLLSRKKRPQLITSFVLNDPGVIARAGADVWEGTITSVVSQLADDHEDPSVRQFRDILKKHAPTLRPGGFALSGFRFAQPLAEALDRAGPNLSAERLVGAIRSLQGYRGGGPYWTGEGLGAPVDFSSGTRLGVNAVRFARATRGRWEIFEDWMKLSP